MRLTINRNQFLKALNYAEKAVASKGALPILQNFKLELTDRGLEVTGTNADLTIKSIIPFTINGKQIITSPINGGTLVDAHRLAEIMRSLDTETVSLDVIDNSFLKIDAGGFSSRLACIRMEEYPDIDLEPSGVTFDATTEMFQSIVTQCAFAAAAREARVFLTAVHLEALEGRLTATATDSQRLAQKTLPLEDENVRFTCNIPARALNEIVHMFDPMDDAVRVSISEQKALFQFGYNVVSTSLIPGDYAKTKDIIPTRFNYYLEVNAQELLSAISRTSLISAERDNAITLSMNEDNVEVFARNERGENSNEKVNTFHYTGSRYSIPFNPLFVIDAIKALGSEDVTLCFQGDMKAFVVRNDQDPSVIELITAKYVS